MRELLALLGSTLAHEQLGSGTVPDTKPLSFRLDHRSYELLREIADQRGLSMGELVRQSLAFYLGHTAAKQGVDPEDFPRQFRTGRE